MWYKVLIEDGLFSDNAGKVVNLVSGIEIHASGGRVETGNEQGYLWFESIGAAIDHYGLVPRPASLPVDGLIRVAELEKITNELIILLNERGLL